MNKIRRVARQSFAIISIIVVVLSMSVNSLAAGSMETKKVIIGGMPFGVSFFAGELKIGGFDDIETESGICSPGRDAGLLKNDIIEKVNERDVKTALDITEAVKGSDGNAVEFLIKRNDERLTVSVTPVLSKKTGEFRIGVWLDDGAAGLGTVTYIDPKTGKFGGLGHGIQKGDSEKLIPLERGVVSRVNIIGVKKGISGEPGELQGEFLSEKLGVVTKNTEVGVFGVLTDIPGGRKEAMEIEIGNADSVKDGGATVYCTVDGEGICEYGICISLMDSNESESKSFRITVTDRALIEKTGGIVRGMSGSPIIQDGKLIGAVTHVLVNDPTKGYGIFIENMLEVEE